MGGCFGEARTKRSGFWRRLCRGLFAAARSPHWPSCSAAFQGSAGRYRRDDVRGCTRGRRLGRRPTRRAAGLYGAIIPDLPFEEGDELFKAFDIAQLDPVFIYSPNTPLKTSRKGQECTRHFTSAPRIPHERGSRRESLNVARLFLRLLAERELLAEIAGTDSLACSAPLLHGFHSWMLERWGVTRVAGVDQLWRADIT